MVIRKTSKVYRKFLGKIMKNPELFRYFDGETWSHLPHEFYNPVAFHGMTMHIEPENNAKFIKDKAGHIVQHRSKSQLVHST